MAKKQNKQLLKIRKEFAQTPRPKSVIGAVDRQSDHALFNNRELSLLEFQRRVLEEAQDSSNPLLERVKFLAIFYGNLNEFFMIRVAGIRKQLQAGITERSVDGMLPGEQLHAIRETSLELLTAAKTCFHDELQPKLTECGVHILSYDDLNKTQKKFVRRYYEAMIFPVLTPLAYDPSRPFPHISNLSMNLAVVIKDKRGLQHFARIKVPESLPRLVPIELAGTKESSEKAPSEIHHFIWLEEVITPHLEMLFPGTEVLEVYPFHVTRDADVEIQELEASDLLETIEEGIRQRRFGSVVRLIVDKKISKSVRDLLVDKMDIDGDDVYTLESPLGLNHLMSLYTSVDRSELKFPSYTPNLTPELRNFEEAQVFERITQGDILLHHPYDSFMPVIEFLWAAAEDPKVLAIKQTLYRVGTNSPVVDALLNACHNGKQVSVLVELKARFDEESNIEWARTLEQEGVHVVYGLLGLKTHSKVALVIRNENNHIRHYAHLGTGNYNHVTAHQYEDVGLFTDDEQIGSDVTHLFNYLTGYSDKTDYKKLMVAPLKMRSQFEQLIRREIKHAKAGADAALIFKTNALVDKSIIQLLYEASAVGVKIDLIVRGICCIRPGITGLSENIRVVSVLGRYLEHSRIYYFYNNGEPDLFIGSADLMPRNLDHRVEVLFPVESVPLQRYLREEVLETYLHDNSRARVMTAEGGYSRVHCGEGEPTIDVQEWLLQHRVSKKN